MVHCTVSALWVLSPMIGVVCPSATVPCGRRFHGRNCSPAGRAGVILTVIADDAGAARCSAH